MRVIIVDTGLSCIVAVHRDHCPQVALAHTCIQLNNLRTAFRLSAKSLALFDDPPSFERRPPVPRSYSNISVSQSGRRAPP